MLNNLTMRHLQSKSLFAFLLFSLIACSGEQKENTEPSQKPKDTAKEWKFDKIEPPIQNLRIEAVTEKINPKKGKFIELKNGGFIDVPINAFLDQNGEVVKEEVDLTFTEYNKPSDFLVSGIPMALELKDTECKFFSSAGMIDISAQSQGKELKPNPENPIQIGMASNTKGTSPLWKFEEGSGWKEIGQPENFEADEIDSLKSVKFPPPPKLADPSKSIFNVTDKLIAKKPNLKQFNNMSFTPIDESESVGEMAQFIRDLDIKKNNNNTYTLTITVHGGRKYITDYYRVYNRKAYERAIKKYNAAYGDYIRKNQSLLRNLGLISENMDHVGNSVLNTFPVNEFGTLNCDQALRIEFAEYTFSANGKKSEAHLDYTLYCLDYTRNAKYPCTSGNKIGIEPESEYAIFATTHDGKICYANKSVCKKALNGKHFDFQLKKFPESKSVAELADLLNN